MNREFLVDVRGDSAVVLLAGDVDLAAVPAVRRALTRATGMRVRKVLIDLAAVTFLDSSGIGAIVAGRVEAARSGLGFEVGAPATPAVARVLAVTGIVDGLALEPPPAVVESGG